MDSYMSSAPSEQGRLEAYARAWGVEPDKLEDLLKHSWQLMKPLPRDSGDGQRESEDGGEWDHLRATWRKIERMWRSAGSSEETPGSASAGGESKISNDNEQVKREGIQGMSEGTGVSAASAATTPDTGGGDTTIKAEDSKSIHTRADAAGESSTHAVDGTETVEPAVEAPVASDTAARASETVATSTAASNGEQANTPHGGSDSRKVAPSTGVHLGTASVSPPAAVSVPEARANITPDPRPSAPTVAASEHVSRAVPAAVATTLKAGAAPPQRSSHAAHTSAVSSSATVVTTDVGPVAVSPPSHAPVAATLATAPLEAVAATPASAGCSSPATAAYRGMLRKAAESFAGRLDAVESVSLPKRSKTDPEAVPINAAEAIRTVGGTAKTDASPSITAATNGGGAALTKTLPLAANDTLKKGSENPTAARDSATVVEGHTTETAKKRASGAMSLPIPVFASNAAEQSPQPRTTPTALPTATLPEAREEKTVLATGKSDAVKDAHSSLTASACAGDVVAPLSSRKSVSSDPSLVPSNPGASSPAKPAGGVRSTLDNVGKSVITPTTVSSKVPALTSPLPDPILLANSSTPSVTGGARVPNGKASSSSGAPALAMGEVSAQEPCRAKKYESPPVFDESHFVARREKSPRGSGSNLEAGAVRP